MEILSLFAQDPDTGETPLTVCSALREDSVCRDMILALVNGGAHLDFRARDGATPMHRVVATGNRAATKVLLELGASPNYKDSRGLSPVHCAISADVRILAKRNAFFFFFETFIFDVTRFVR